LDYDRGTRTGQPDIGADEFSAGCPDITVPPTASTIGTIGNCDADGNPTDPGVVTDVLPTIERTNGVFPVPANETLYLNRKEETYQYTIVDSRGSVMITKQSNKPGIDVSSLPNGLYFLIINLKDKSVETHRFVKSY
jgi:hypothetical protein